MNRHGKGLLVFLVILVMTFASGCGGKQRLVDSEAFRRPDADQGILDDDLFGAQDAIKDGEGGPGGEEPEPRQQAANLELNQFDGGFFSVMLPKGWRLQTMGRYSTFGFRAWDPNNPDYQIFYYGILAPLNKSYEAKALWKDYVNNFGYPNAQVNADAPVVDLYDAGSIFYGFDALNGMSEKYGLGFSFPGLANFNALAVLPIQTPFSSIASSEALIFAELRGDNGGACYGKFTASFWNSQPYYINNVDMSPTSAMTVTGVIAPQADFLAVEAALTQAAFSLRFTQEYLNEAIDYIHRTGEAAMANNEHIQQIYDAANLAWDLYIRE
ncbi:MAG: hypothetical protein ACOYI3_03580 [Christensenellales bacterium]